MFLAILESLNIILLLKIQKNYVASQDVAVLESLGHVRVTAAMIQDQSAHQSGVLKIGFISR